MRNRSYVVVLLDFRGRTLRRVGVQYRSLVGGALAVAAVIVVMVGTIAHGIARYGRAVEAAEINTENQELASLSRSVEARLPAARLMARRAELTFSQLWSKSGLGKQPNTLGVGPLADAEAPFGAPSFSGQLLGIDPVEVPMELDRLEAEGRQLQTSLAELLEYLHDAERLLSNTPSINPARSRWATSSYGRRHDPMTGHWLMHKGIDLGGATGQPIYAPADGVVIFTGRRGGYGMTIVLDHGFGIQTHFAHLSRYRVLVGKRVRRGQVIAAMGSTGKSTGPHLHYEVRRFGQPLNPAPFILD